VVCDPTRSDMIRLHGLSDGAASRVNPEQTLDAGLRSSRCTLTVDKVRCTSNGRAGRLSNARSRVVVRRTEALKETQRSGFDWAEPGDQGGRARELAHTPAEQKVEGLGDGMRAERCGLAVVPFWARRGIWRR
jgi:hypothetical protein